MKKVPGSGVLALQHYLKLWLLLLLSLTSLSCISQVTLNKDSLTYSSLNQIIPEVQKYFNAPNLSVFGVSLKEWPQMKKTQHLRLYELLSNKVDSSEIENFINYQNVAIHFDKSQLFFPIVNNAEFDLQAQESRYWMNKKKYKKKIIVFPVIAISTPYFFNKFDYCITSIVYRTTFHIATFGYYFFKKNEHGKWVFVASIFESIS